LGELGSQRLLPVLPELRMLLPGGGLRRGSTLAITSEPETTSAAGSPTASPPAAAATSLLLALLAEASRAGSWCAVVGLPTLSVLAAAELGIALDRLALVPYPGPQWPTAVAALLDGLDLVVTAVPGPISAVIAGRLGARARQRGSVLIPFGPWPGAALTLEAVDARWHGLEEGRGRLYGRQLTVVARGRGAAGVPRQASMWLPRPTGLLADRAQPAHAPIHGEPLATVYPLRPSSTMVESTARAG
jgi:hypothetical protein